MQFAGDRGKIYTMKLPSSAEVIVPGSVHIIKRWLDAKIANERVAHIIEETYDRWVGQLAYSHGKRYFDRGHTMSRFGDAGVTYSFKGKEKPMYPMTSTLSHLRDDIARELDWVANCCVINSYAPTSSLYPHRDGAYIPQLGTNPTIVAVSFGASRSFLLHPIDKKSGKRSTKNIIDVKLSHGDLLIMHGSCDANYHHSIQSDPSANDARVSLTFRQHIISE